MFTKHQKLEFSGWTNCKMLKNLIAHFGQSSTRLMNAEYTLPLTRWLAQGHETRTSTFQHHFKTIIIEKEQNVLTRWSTVDHNDCILHQLHSKWISIHLNKVQCFKQHKQPVIIWPQEHGQFKDVEALSYKQKHRRNQPAIKWIKKDTNVRIKQLIQDHLIQSSSAQL